MNLEISLYLKNKVPIVNTTGYDIIKICKIVFYLVEKERRLWRDGNNKFQKERMYVYERTNC